MRPKNAVALFLVIIGTNIFTYAFTRRATTERLLTRAQNRMIATIKKDGYYAAAYPSELPPHVTYALYGEGGRYFWHNEALSYFALGGCLIAFGYVVARVDIKKKEG